MEACENISRSRSVHFFVSRLTPRLVPRHYTKQSRVSVFSNTKLTYDLFRLDIAFIMLKHQTRLPSTHTHNRHAIINTPFTILVHGGVQYHNRKRKGNKRFYYICSPSSTTAAGRVFKCN